MEQKFRKLTFVYVCKEMPPEMSHFDSDFDAIVDGTYSQKYGGKDVKSYSLFRLQGGKIVDRNAWYMENQLTELPFQDRAKAEELIEQYHFRKII